jgi:hypothetical protein
MATIFLTSIVGYFNPHLTKVSKMIGANCVANAQRIRMHSVATHTKKTFTSF